MILLMREKMFAGKTSKSISDKYIEVFFQGF